MSRSTLKDLTAKGLRNPGWALRRVLSQAYHYTENAVRYGNFSLNMNSRKYWDDRLRAYGDYWRDENYRQVVKIFPENEPFSLLDVGCALGDGTRLLRKCFPHAKIAGCDFSEVGIEKAKTKSDDIEYFILDIQKQHIPGSYDYITVIQTLEHFSEPFEIVDKCLKHCGRSLVISVPYTESYSGRIRIVDEHKYAFNESSFAEYDCMFMEVTEYLDASGSRCIIFELRP